MDLIEQFRRHVAALDLSPGKALVAVSGGPDSVTLLDLLVRTRDSHGLELVVAHLDHGIHPDSRQVADQVRTLAESYGLPFEHGQLSLGSLAGETVARIHRYAWLEAVRARVGAETIMTAHHADDQAETVLMRVLAGSGPAGLAGIAPVQGKIVRPLLPFTRAELTRHLQDVGLAAWLDPANSDPRHLRSWLRTEVLPLLRGRLPRVDAGFLRVAAQAAQNRAAWDAILDLLPGLDLRLENGGISVAAPGLADYDSALGQAVILALARRVGCRLGPSRLERVVSLLQRRVSGARVPLGGSWNAELSFDRLRLYSTGLEQPAHSWELQGQRGEGNWGRWQFYWERTAAPAHQDRVALSAWFTLDPLTVRAWHPGERLKPLGGRGHRLVVRCFQEGRIPRSRRGAWPVLAQSEDVIWIPGVCRSDVRLPARGSEALRVDAEYA